MLDWYAVKQPDGLLGIFDFAVMDFAAMGLWEEQATTFLKGKGKSEEKAREGVEAALGDLAQGGWTRPAAWEKGGLCRWHDVLVAGFKAHDWRWFVRTCVRGGDVDTVFELMEEVERRKKEDVMWEPTAEIFYGVGFEPGEVPPEVAADWETAYLAAGGTSPAPVLLAARGRKGSHVFVAYVRVSRLTAGAAKPQRLRGSLWSDVMWDHQLREFCEALKLPEKDPGWFLAADRWS